MGRRLAALVLALATSMAAGACKHERSCEPAADGSVVACLNDSPIPRAEVEQHLRPQGPAPGRATPPNPRSVALEAALRVRLFAAEARRRGLEVDGPASQSTARLNRALISDELERQHIGAEHISDAEARAFYEAHPGRVNQIDAVHCLALYADDPARAEALYGELHGAGRDAFVAAGGADIGAIHHLDPTVEQGLVQLASTLREAGAVSGPVKTADGRYALLYADSLDMTVAPFEGAVVAQTKNTMARDAERAALDALFDELRARSRVVVFDDALAALPEPQRKP